MSIDRNILEREVTFRTSRSSGPGGQSVNKTETRVEVLFSLEESVLFNEGQKERIRVKLASRLNNEGTLIIAASDSRSQWANKKVALDRLQELLEAALRVQRPRKIKRPGRAYHEKRLERKNQRSEVKQSRNWKYKG